MLSFANKSSQNKDDSGKFQVTEANSFTAKMFLHCKTYCIRRKPKIIFIGSTSNVSRSSGPNEDHRKINKRKICSFIEIVQFTPPLTSSTATHCIAPLSSMPL